MNKKKEEAAQKKRDYAIGTASLVVQSMNDKSAGKRSSHLPFVKWEKNKFGTCMDSNTCKKVFRNALLLTEAGFSQDKNKPYLFKFFFAKQSVIFASFEYAGVRELQEHTAALIRCDLDPHENERNIMVEITSGVIQKCRELGVEVSRDSELFPPSPTQQ